MDARDQLISAKLRRQYCIDVLTAGGLAPWEAKEYTQMEAAYAEHIKYLEDYIASYHDVFQ